ncbi:MAG: Uma2 family endonuclease [Polyangiaceae bacterium]|nr:Uma2 family endonuclease [Polyangiaceae bacterium]
MAVIEVSEPFAYGGHLYVKAPKPVFFRSEETLEEAVPETKRHLEARSILYLFLKDALAGAAIGSDQFVYFDPEDPRKCLSPDAFVKLGCTDTMFDHWKVWENGAPDVAVEIVSTSDRRTEPWADKLRRYRSSGIGELVRFDQDNKNLPIRVWDRVDGDLVERAHQDPNLHECAALGMWWVVVPSLLGPMLRLARDKEGTQILPTPDEERLRLARELAEERTARSQAEHERKVAEHERDLALAQLKKLQAKASKPRTKRRGTSLRNLSHPMVSLPNR